MTDAITRGNPFFGDSSGNQVQISTGTLQLRPPSGSLQSLERAEPNVHTISAELFTHGIVLEHELLVERRRNIDPTKLFIYEIFCFAILPFPKRFTGFIMTDWWATADPVNSANNGLNVLSDMATRVIASWYKMGQDKNTCRDAQGCIGERSKEPRGAHLTIAHGGTISLTLTNVEQKADSTFITFDPPQTASIMRAAMSFEWWQTTLKTAIKGIGNVHSPHAFEKIMVPNATGKIVDALNDYYKHYLAILDATSSNSGIMQWGNRS
ncbi:hypothetical protein BJ742DRAFT_741952 [Cladochytrium replicatum]|nr:hypothetical protein BJ742DRAFT_741952 [Cladochytrium replicatum]